MIVVHLRWTDVGPEQLEKVRTALPDRTARPGGCLSRTLRCRGGALWDTEVWCSEDEARTFMGRLTASVAPIGLGRPSHTAVFAVPDQFAVTYLRTGRPPGYLPSPRGIPDDEMLPAIVSLPALR